LARRKGPFAYRALARIERKAEERAEEVALHILELIYINAPDRKTKWERDGGGPPLKESFYARTDEATGSVVIASRRRYWAFVEFGTLEHGSAQPYLRPAIEAARRYYR
jgi:hypothetical protein